MGASVIEYKGKKIIYADYRGLTDKEEMIKVLDQGLALHKANPDSIGVITNFTDTYLSQDFVEKIKQDTKGISGKIALIGITGVKKILINAINKVVQANTKIHDDEISAKEWLIS